MDIKKPIVSLTTIPTRLINNYQDDMRFCVESLLNQTYSDYEVHINIPHVLKKSKVEYVLPEWLIELEKSNQRLKIFRTDDYGPLTKLFPTVLRVNDPETLLIICDDDLVYHENMVSEHVKNQEKFPEAVVGYDGMRSRNEDGSFSDYFKNVRDYYYSGNRRDALVDILQHYKTISYKRRYFESDFFYFIHDYYSWSDDLLLSAYFASKKRDRIATYYEQDPVLETMEDWHNGVGKTFPLIRSTQHDSLEGCNLFRSEQIEDNHKNLYAFIDVGYQK